MKLNNKGFSLIEILAVVVILGIVSTIGIVSVTRLIDNSKKHYYEAQQNNLVLAARAYASDHKEVLPRNSSALISLTPKETTPTSSPVDLLPHTYQPPYAPLLGPIRQNPPSL